MSEPGLVRTITMTEGIALYVGAVVGAGVLVLPGVAASLAGPGSLIAWTIDCLLGLSLALTFASLAARFPDAGGVASFASRAFGPGWGAAVGWFYFFASATGQIIVPLTGAYYATAALEWRREATFLMAGAILAIAVSANLRGLRLSGRLQLMLSGGVALVLLAATVAALPRVQVQNLLPLFPNGVEPVGRTAVLLFFALFGWEAIAQLSAEFRDPGRDVLRSTVWSAVLVTVLYMGVAFAVVATGTYGNPTLDRVAVARLMADTMGLSAGAVASGTAVLISLGTANAFVAATSRLGYALGRDDAFPAWMSRLNNRQVPQAAVLAVGGFAATGLAVSFVWGWDVEKLMVVPNSLGIATYLIGTAAGLRLLSGSRRFLAFIAFALCLAIFPFAGASVVLPLLVSAGAVWYRKVRIAERCQMI